MANKQSFYAFELGVTTGPYFFQGNYLAFEYTKKSASQIQTSFFMSYSVYQFDNFVDYETQFTTLERTVPSGNNEEFRTYRTRVIDYRIDRLNLTEIGISAKYDIGKRTTLRAMATYVLTQSVWGEFSDHSYDSTFKVVDEQRTLNAAYEPNDDMGHFRRSDVTNIGIKNHFFLHAGIDYRISKRTRFTAKAGIPLGEIFPTQIGYDHYSRDTDITLQKLPTDLPKRPMFYKVGLSLTL